MLFRSGVADRLGEGPNSVLHSLREIGRMIHEIDKYDPKLAESFQEFDSAQIELREIETSARDYLEEIEIDPAELARLFADWVEDDPDWELVAPQLSSLVVFRRKGSDEENEAILERVNRSGEIFLSHTKLDDRYVLRLAIGNARTTEGDVRRAWEVLRT